MTTDPSRLSRRLEALRAALPDDCILGDVGCDHALLALHAVAGGPARRAVAIDVREEPLAAARRRVASSGVGERVELRRGDGLRALGPGEVDVVCIAGMGGERIRRLLEAAPSLLSTLRRLVLQPRCDEDVVRRWLATHGWELVAEVVVHEGGEDDEVLVAEPGDGLAAHRGVPPGREHSLLAGPHLLRGARAYLARRWSAERVRLDAVLEELADVPGTAAAQRRAEVTERLRLVRELVAELERRRAPLSSPGGP